MFTLAKENQQPIHHDIHIGLKQQLTLSDAKLAGDTTRLVMLNAESRPAIDEAYSFLKSRADSRLPVYGVNTNFGDQVSFIDAHLHTKDKTVYEESIRLRQENIIKSLACGVGDYVSTHVVRVTMMLRAHCLSQGYSGISIEAIETLLTFLNANIIPAVPCYGSIGASGDLIPLATIAAALMGENVPVFYQQTLMPAPQAIELAGVQTLKPQLRDGLALINGTSFMTAIASITLYDLKRLFKQMLAAIAMSLESMLVISSAYHPLVHRLKHHSGQIMVNQFLNNFWKDSQLLTDLDQLRADPQAIKPVQDYYSLRAIPQGFGTLYENLERTTHWIENEMNSVNDNPIIDTIENKIHHNANFMGYYVTTTCDLLKTEIAQASTWLHALLANMVHPRKSHHLPANLVNHPGQQNGFRSLQLLAAALAVQNRKLAQSHQSFTLPTEGDNQDVNSLGTHAALDFKEATANLERLTAILLLASAQGLELRGVEKASSQAQQIYQLLRQYSPTVAACRPMSEELENIIGLLKDEKI